MPLKPLNIFFLVLLCLLFVSCNRSNEMFMSLPASKTNIDFTNELQKKDAFGILYYLYYYNGGGVAIGDVNNDGLPDIYFTANSNGNNRLYLNKGNFEFEDITEKAGVAGIADWCTGVTMADINGDGFLDIYVCAVTNAYGLQGHNQLFMNNGFTSSSADAKGSPKGVTFTESSFQYGLNFSGFSTQSVFLIMTMMETLIVTFSINPTSPMKT